MIVSKLSVLVFVCSALLVSCAKPEQPAVNVAKPANAAPEPAPTVDLALMAAELYALNCMICHKDSGKGGKATLEGKTINAEDLTADKIKKMTDEKLIGYVTNGIEDEGMPAFKGKFTDDEIKRVVRHVRVLQSQ
jgi:mono/diheme cytochrome c family protein